MPYFDQKSKKWRGVVKQRGKRYTSLFLTKADAKSWETKKREELENPSPQETSTGMDLLSACNNYLDFCELRYSSKTYREKKSLCETILKKWSNTNIENITTPMVLKHLTERMQRTSPNTWNRDRKNLLAMFNWLQKIHGVTNNPVTRIERMPEERKTEYLPSGEDINKVMLAAGGQDRVMLICYYYTFARRSELFEWTWHDINFEKEWYRLWTRKRVNSDRQADYFPMPKSSELYNALWWQWNNRNKNSQYVFTNPETGTRYFYRRKFLKGLCKRAGVAPFGFKAFRKYGPSVLNDEHKVSMKKLQRLLRHRSQRTTEIYLKDVDDDLAAVVKFLEVKDTKRDTKTKNDLARTA